MPHKYIHYIGTCLSNEIDGVSELRKELHHTNIQFLWSRLPYSPKGYYAIPIIVSKEEKYHHQMH